MAKSTPEGRIKAAVQKRLEHYGVLPFIKAADAKGQVEGMYWMPVQGAYAVHGVHDFVINWRGTFCTIETKAPDNKVDATEPQLAFQAATVNAGGVSLVGVRSADAVDRLYELLCKRWAE